MRIAVDLDDVADMFSVIADGGIILSKAVNDKDFPPHRIILYRDCVRNEFQGKGRSRWD